MINLKNNDGILHDIPFRVVDILKEFKETGRIEIDMNSEGPCCEQLGVFKILDHICQIYNIDKSNVTIITMNQLEKHPEYSIQIRRNRFYDNEFPIPNFDHQLPIGELKHVGMFTVRSTWPRLWLAGSLDRTKSLISFHYDRNDDYHRANLGLDEMLKWGATYEDLQKSIDLLKDCPMTFDRITYPAPRTSWAGLLAHDNYRKIFLELTCESYFSGNAFFVTEKTLRPIIGMKPFIIHATPNYLSELKKLGYQTFGKWWDEGYDDYGEQLRIRKMQEVITEIMSWDQEKLRQVYQEMLPVLEHNRKVYFESKQG